MPPRRCCAATTTATRWSSCSARPLSATRTLGWERPYIGWNGGDLANASTIGHTGFTGTGLWLDFDNRRAWALLTNRVHPSRYSDSGILQLRRAVGDAVVGGE